MGGKVGRPHPGYGPLLTDRVLILIFSVDNVSDNKTLYYMLSVGGLIIMKSEMRFVLISRAVRGECYFRFDCLPSVSLFLSQFIMLTSLY